MTKYCKTWNKQGHNEQECWIIHPELHRIFDEVVGEHSKGKEVVGTAAKTTKVLSSGKVVEKSIPNTTK